MDIPNEIPEAPKQKSKVNIRNLMLLIIVTIVAFIGLYYYEDQQVTIAVNDVHSSLILVDYSFELKSLLPPSGEYTYKYKLNNPSNFDVYYSYYADAYIGTQYIQTIKIQAMVLAGKDVVVETKSSVGGEAVKALIANPNPTFHYKGNFECSGKPIMFSITKKWSSKWDWTQTK